MTVVMPGGIGGGSRRARPAGRGARTVASKVIPRVETSRMLHPEVKDGALLTPVIPPVGKATDKGG